MAPTGAAMNERTTDPKLYRELSAPFDKAEDANAALSAFFRAVDEARKVHRIADVVVLCEVNTIGDGVVEVRGSASASYGDMANVTPMLAREYGASRERDEQRLAAIIARARKGR
jgi:hypothetical protein